MRRRRKRTRCGTGWGSVAVFRIYHGTGGGAALAQPLNTAAALATVEIGSPPDWSVRTRSTTQKIGATPGSRRWPLSRRVRTSRSDRRGVGDRLVGDGDEQATGKSCTIWVGTVVVHPPTAALGLSGPEAVPTSTDRDRAVRSVDAPGHVASPPR